MISGIFIESEQHIVYRIEERRQRGYSERYERGMTHQYGLFPHYARCEQTEIIERHDCGQVEYKIAGVAYTYKYIPVDERCFCKGDIRAVKEGSQHICHYHKQIHPAAEGIHPLAREIYAEQHGHYSCRG